MDIEVYPHPDFDGVFQVKLEDGSQKIATKNLCPGRNVYGERLIRICESEYRLWDPFRSKIAAAVLKRLDNFPIKKRYGVLYLGAASGTTASHVSDIVGKKGYVFCVEFSPRSIRDLINNVCKFRRNMAPILADARFPKQYASLISKVDTIYCDVAQPEQALVLVHNAEAFLKDNSLTMLSVKARSIDVTKEPSQIYKREAEVLKKRGFIIYELVPLEPYEKDHVMIVAKWIHRR